MKIQNASPGDLPLLLDLRKQASAWLREDLGIDQWANPFPSEHILGSINARSVYLVKDGERTAATVTLDSEPEPDLWSSAELEEPSLHMHKLIVLRAYAGRDLGQRIIAWASDLTARAGGRWLRINVTTNNRRLQRYYLNAGFEYVRTADGGGVGGAGVACWLAQLPAQRNSDHGLQDDSALLPAGIERDGDTES